MELKAAVDKVASKFKYRSDPKFLDYWMVMNDDMKGDCDDFTMTVMWFMCNGLLSFIWNVLILHKYRLWYAVTHTGEKHMVGEINGMFFDNWSYKALPKKEFIEVTGHKLKFFFISPLMILPMLLGVLLKFICR